ncbi:MAG: hypothetical protein JO192_12625 [Candidatus Eremiobacteraeota bacterium]|nr:hypothetical protein [Candidatus Eremiobacteraeota bacterium]MBV8333574.1 hypothetical protein [Candidatus Eremiobacteraeota bacterium]MBV8720539.1 hypothetical protein [Candidatus Eremiobacteraeota bacterium]
MNRRVLRYGFYSLCAIVMISCAGQSTVPVVNGGANAPNRALKPSSSCYSGDNGTPYTTSATVTFYGWPDNSPPGAAIAHPVIHSVAGGDGSYCNPTTFATEPTSSENKKFPYGTRLYVPLVQKYFIREDDCTTSGPQGLGCSGTWFDLWIGGDANSNSNDVINCENSITPNGKVNVIVHPDSSEPVAWTGPIWSDQLGCNKGGTKPTPTPSPHPSTSPTASPTPGGGSNATIGWYDYFQNGNGCSIAHPVIHSCAGGSGTYSNPITFAAPTSDNSSVPYGTRLYLPSLQRYFIREDDCSSSDCSNGSTFLLWIGGNSSDVASDMQSCENYLTSNYLKNPNTPVVLNPASNEPVSSLGQIWNENDGTCNGSSNY